MTAAANTAETWVRQHELPQLGLAVRSVKRAVAEGRFVSRREGRERLVKLSSLPREVQERYLERERAGADEWVRRLGRFPAETREAIRIEAARRGEDIGSPVTLDAYQRWRRFDSTALALGMDTVNRLFSNDNAILRMGRDLGMGLVNRLPGLRRGFIRQAAGLTGELPRLLAGQAI